MSKQYSGGLITKNPVVPTASAAPGVWTLEQQMQAQKAETWPTAFPNYIEDVFSTYLYSGTSATQSINNGVDLAGKGGMIWTSYRAGSNPVSNWVIDTQRGITKYVRTHATNAEATTSEISSFNNDGYTLSGGTELDYSGNTYASWTFRKQKKFFDVVTWTGNGGSGNRQIAHSLGSVPGFITMKNTSSASSWPSYHRSLGANFSVDLNTTGASGASSYYPATPTSTYFEINAGGSFNTSGQTYVAYLFAHDAGGFGLTGTDNVISCGTYTGNGSATGPKVTLGYEPQWILIKRSSTTGSGWVLHDTMRGLPTGGVSAYLQANVSDAEAAAANYVDVNATGFQLKTTGVSWNASGNTYIYIAIRRGPMKVPTDGTKVLGFDTQSSFAINELVDSTFPPDMFMAKARGAGSWDVWTASRLAGGYLATTGTAAETSGFWKFDGAGGKIYASTAYTDTPIYWQFKRAPSFFDTVCYTGTGSVQTQNHNLGVAPELMIVKCRSNGPTSWPVYCSALGTNKYVQLNSVSGPSTNTTTWNNTAPTSSVFTVGSSDGLINASGYTYVAYLFATCPGVSKVGNYTGNGSSQTLNCGFTGGARFIMIKRTDTNGDWYVWDTSRGIVAGNDPHISMNTTAAEVTTDDTIDTDSSGFIVNQLAATNVNVNAATYIYLAIA